MNLSAKPETICVRMDVPRRRAAAWFAHPGEVASRHQVEKSIQEHFFITAVDAFISEGKGSIESGHFFILTDHPAATLETLKALLGNFPAARGCVKLLPFVHIGLLDTKTKTWRTFYPLTTRPFWTFLNPEATELALRKGRSARQLKILLNE